MRALPFLALILACSSDGTTTDIETADGEEVSGGDTEVADVTDEQEPGETASDDGVFSHARAVALLKEAHGRHLADTEGQDCVPPESPLSVAEVIADAADNAEEQKTDCTAGAEGLDCTSEFSKSTGGEGQEFYIRLQYGVATDGSELLSIDGCVAAG